MNIFESIKAEAQAWLRKDAVIEGESRLTYAQLISSAEAFAETLKQEGVAPLNRVGLHCDDSTEYIVASLAVLSLSAVVVPVTPKQKPEEIADIIDKICLDYLVADSGLDQTKNHPDTFRVIGKDFLVERLPCSSPHLPAYSSTNPAFIRFSSGTTGTSKGVLLSHESIADRLDAANQGMQVTSNDVVLWVLSMSFHFVVTILLFLRCGATIVLCGKRYPESLIEGVNRHGGTFIYASPFYYSLLSRSEDIKQDALKNIRLAISTTIKLPTVIAEDFYNKFEFELSEAYGIIEVGLPFIRLSGGAAKRGSVGKPLPDFEIKFENQDAEGVGEIYLRGKGMLDAYFSPWQGKDTIMHDGWFSTGDLGKLDAEGFLFIVGRNKEVINMGGLKIFPQEVEAILNQHPLVKESLVYGVTHSEYGQLPMAKIVLTDNQIKVDANMFRQHCATHLAQYKTPKAFEFVSELPKTNSGKIKR